jgi:hypothetical protein
MIGPASASLDVAASVLVAAAVGTSIDAADSSPLPGRALVFSPFPGRPSRINLGPDGATGLRVAG